MNYTGWTEAVKDGEKKSYLLYIVFNLFCDEMDIETACSIVSEFCMIPKTCMN